ncbi:hypothetical protein XENOCAPTIV_001858 [Xenoophorus captivus]|uniref:Uncharacterized protein n=1 Tax=Xenoophorus captivus TaxID=1517983 RepID=A0ABV0QPC7_9TELE
MKETYYLQRKHINDTQAHPIKELKYRWLYLFMQKHLTAHFEELTSINAQNQLNHAMEDCGSLLIDFFRNKPTNELIKKILSADEEVGIMVTKLLLAHFQEDQGGLLLCADRCATAADLEGTHNLPPSPRLIALGDGFTFDQWMISIEGEIVSEGTQPTFLAGLAALFATFVFNLEYP